jgi:hypothetical protein
LNKRVWKTVVVYCDPQTQLERLMKRNNFTHEDAMKRIEAQQPIEEKRRRADVVIDSSGSFEDTSKQVCFIELIFRCAKTTMIKKKKKKLKPKDLFDLVFQKLTPPLWYKLAFHGLRIVLVSTVCICLYKFFKIFY